MNGRPQVRKVKKNRYQRCPKCRKIIRLHQKRCRTCHVLQPKPI